MQFLGEKIQRFRRMRHITQKELATKTYMPLDRIRRIEACTILPTNEDLDFICRVFNIDTNDFLTYVEFRKINYDSETNGISDYALAEMIREARQKENLSLSELSYKSDIPLDKIYGIENHKNNIAKIYYVMLARYFGLVRKD